MTSIELQHQLYIILFIIWIAIILYIYCIEWIKRIILSDFYLKLLQYMGHSAKRECKSKRDLSKPPLNLLSIYIHFYGMI